FPCSTASQIGSVRQGTARLIYTELMLPVLPPLPLTRRPQAFSDPDWLFEIKYDGFRALAYCDPSGVRLVSRNGNRFASFTDLCAGIELFLKARHAVLDGEIACLDDQGHSQSISSFFAAAHRAFACSISCTWMG